MKKYCSIIYIVGLAFAGLIFTGCATGPAAGPIPPNSGHLLIYRVPNFGTGLALTVSVDGHDVGSFTEGRHYSGYLPAGQHHIAARVDPVQPGKGPARKTMNCTSWADLLVYRSLVGRESGFGEEPGSIRASLLNRKV